MVNAILKLVLPLRKKLLFANCFRELHAEAAAGGIL